mmetsp:Transcript_91146/g.272078  ORF Transcript_91146/g.272078 Transcript_91146/m.272078 type:complete len:205 (+) Transcript_91146:109-723(+)
MACCPARLHHDRLHRERTVHHPNQLEAPLGAHVRPEVRAVHAAALGAGVAPVGGVRPGGRRRQATQHLPGAPRCHSRNALCGGGGAGALDKGKAVCDETRSEGLLFKVSRPDVEERHQHRGHGLRTRGCAGGDLPQGFTRAGEAADQGDHRAHLAGSGRDHLQAPVRADPAPGMCEHRRRSQRQPRGSGGAAAHARRGLADAAD